MERARVAVVSQLRWIARARSGPAAVMQTVISRGFVLGINLLNGVLCARNLGPTGRGDQAAMLLWPQLICFALTFGIPFAVVYESRKHREDRDSLFSAALILSAMLGVVAAVIGVIFIPTWLHKYGPRVVSFSQLLMIFSPQIMIGITVSAIFESQFEFSIANFSRYAPPVVTLVALVSLLVRHAFTPYLTALAYALPTALTMAIIAPKLFGVFRFTMRHFVESSKRLFRYGVRIYGSDILGTFGTQIDQVLVVGLLSPSNLGTYTVALSVSRILNIFQLSIRTVLLPKVAGLERREIARMVASVARISTAFTTLAAIGLLVILPFALPRLYGSDFRSAVFVAQILTLESILSSTIGVLTQAFNATNRPGATTLLQGLGLAVAVPFMFAFIPRFGLVGAALALLMSTTTRLGFALICFPLLLHENLPGLLLDKDDISFVRAAIAQRRGSGLEVR